MAAEDLATTEGQVVESAGDEDMADVERRVALVQLAVVDVQGADGVEAEVAVGVVDVARPGVGGCEIEGLCGAVVELRLQAVVVRHAVVDVVYALLGAGESVASVGWFP